MRLILKEIPILGLRSEIYSQRKTIRVVTRAGVEKLRLRRKRIQNRNYTKKKKKVPILKLAIALEGWQEVDNSDSD